jgi:hypothetical protein
VQLDCVDTEPMDACNALDQTEGVGQAMSAVQSVAGNPDVQDVALDLVRDRLAGLGRQYTPVDVPTAMRAEVSL